MSKRQTKQGQQYKKNRKTTAAPQKKQEGMSTATKVVIGVFAVLMALSMSGVFSMFANIAGNDTTANTTVPTSIEELDERYTEIVDPLEQKVAADATDMESTVQLARAYMNWGYNVSYMATVDAETSHANELFTKAMALFDTYIASNPEDVGQAKVDRALCLLYSGETTASLSALKDITVEDPTNAIAWANYGLVCEITGDTATASEAYSQAIANDPDDEKGAKSYASSRLLSLNNDGSESLPGTLRDLSDTGV